MNIVINTVPLLSPLTGVGKYTYHLAKTLKEMDRENSYTYFYGFYSKHLLVGEWLKPRTNFAKVKKLINKGKLSMLMRKATDIYARIFPKNFHLYVEPNFVLLPHIKAKRAIVCVFDFSLHIYPDWHPKERVAFFRENFWKHINRADIIILPSRFTLHEAKVLNLDDTKMRVIYPGIDETIFRSTAIKDITSVKKKYRLPEHFILFVGSIEPRKNLKNLVKAYSCLPKDLKNMYRLVFVGHSGWKNDEIFRVMKKESVIYAGYVPEEDLPALFNLASVFVFPSFYEGFGLPPLEAMACGCPTIVSNAASLPEVCGDAAYYVNPEDIEDIAQGMMKVLTDKDLRIELRKRGYERAKLFSWKSTAEKYLWLFGELSTLKK